MRLLLDATFSASAVGPQPGGHHIDRYAGGPLGDVDLVGYAGEQGYDAVVFLGSDTLADARVLEASTGDRPLVAVTSSPDPDEAELAVRANLNALVVHIGVRRAVIIRKTSVRSA